MQYNFTNKIRPDQMCAKASVPQGKSITITERNIKVSKGGYIQISKHFDGVNIRISTNLKANESNLLLVRENAINYIKAHLKKIGYQGYADEQNSMCADDYLYQSVEHYLYDESNKHLKDSTFGKYKTIINSIQKTYPHKRTNALDINFLNNFALRLHTKGASKTDIRFKVHFILNVINFYREHFNLTPLDKKSLNITRFGKDKKEVVTFSDDEIQRIMKHSSGELHDYIVTAAHTGARVGEILAIRKEDVQDDGISITKTLTQKGTITSPKTKSSNRVVPFINDFVKQHIQNLCARSSANKELIQIGVSRLHYQWKRLLKRLNIKHRPIYHLRHTFATLGIAKTKDFQSIGAILGHKNLQTTLTFYAQNCHNNIRFEYGESTLNKEVV